ncbi:hypothetical protein BDV37DRAFT_276160 [Aspergillus pseudonomiae]|uniref:Uncharacterized protein n=1 Tax=Aspergillus pseudonomiae TaxID=1506151 RepID=A0A5N7CW28_9EURO|nr:uncharacterized protein BDV37DRAFT_276160 [Aspergillus pseudonomiae]KAE8398374.1 hypothetical protein BDV37DRAFT_276160 [Aspergillus pseudonomiae]
MSKTRQLLHGDLTYSHAKAKEINILHQLSYPGQQTQFFALLQNKCSWIRVIVAHHRNLPSINACQKRQSGNRGLVHFPLPHRIGENFRRGNRNKKIRCEAGTYAWFGMATGETFTRTENLPVLTRCIQDLHHRVLFFLGRPSPSIYPLSMLSSTWSLKREDVKIPLHRIGSFIINNNRFICFKNRLLSLGIQDLENKRILTDISQDYIRLRYQLNAINNLVNYIYQISSFTTIRVIFLLFFNRNYRRGPFIFSLTDLYPSNIFVDKNWNITALTKKEGSCFSIYKDSFSVSLQLLYIMSVVWYKGTFWYNLALSSPTGRFAIFDKELQPRFIDKYTDHDAFYEIIP